ncbi:MAG: UvrD-helicase domain-containing protein [Gemmataceae bacterium]
MTEQELLKDLNDSQREAVTHVEGPLLILAGAGSGKTRVITRRVAYLLHLGIHPANILAITFTNKAAGEMRQRVNALVPGHGVWVSTFHSLGVRLLRQYADQLGMDRSFTIYDQDDRVKLVKMAMEDAQVSTERFTPESAMNAISKAKNQLISPQRYAQTARDFFSMTVAKVYDAYERRIRDANAVDFDDLLYWPALALKHNADLRAELDARFRYILIDEYQDTNQAQYQIARRLSSDHPNLCVVGDPDQSIYKFRGSDIRNILDFERDFPTARVLTLELNYRSTRSILSAASGLIAHNLQRKPKDLITLNPTGPRVTVAAYHSGVDEAEGIARRIAESVRAGKRNFRDHAILVRINALTRGLEQAFIRHRVPFQIVKGLGFFDRKENKDVLAYVKLLLNPRDDVSFERIINVPARGIGATTLALVRSYADQNEITYLAACGRAEFLPGIKGRQATALRNFHVLMEQLGAFLQAQPDEVIRQVLELSGYRKMLKESGDEEDQQRLANIEELITAAAQFAEQNNQATIADWLENITLSSDVDAFNEQQDCVAVMTMHTAKGLEFPVVFLVAVEMGILPHQRAIASHKEEEIEEERRLMFVGMTRAREELFLTHARNIREFRGQDTYPVPSRFLDEIPPEVVERVDTTGALVSAGDRFRTGSDAARAGWREAGIEIPLPARPRQDDPFPVNSLVKHAQYGVGRVLAFSGSGATRTVKIRFQTAGEHSFRLNFVKLEIIRRDDG